MDSFQWPQRPALLLIGFLFLSACRAAILPESDAGFQSGDHTAGEGGTPIELPARWTATPTRTPLPVESLPASPTGTQEQEPPAQEAGPYAMETLGAAFTLRSAAIHLSDLPEGFIAYSAGDLHNSPGEGINDSGVVGGMEPLNLVQPDPAAVAFDSDTLMNFTMLVNESAGISVISIAYLFSTEEEQLQYDLDLSRPLEQPSEIFPELEEGEMYQFGPLTGFEQVGEISQAVELRIQAENENGGEQSIVYRMVHFRRGAVGASLLVMGVDGIGLPDLVELAELLDARIVAALDHGGGGQ